MTSSEVMKKTQIGIVQYIKSDVVSKRVNDLLGKRAAQFTTSLIAVANANALLAKCEPQSVLTAALTAASMDLPINQNLGFAYLIPYKDKSKGGIQVCQFQMGYKGFIQLAQRSGFYKTINAVEVRQGEIVRQDRLTGEIEFNWIEDDVEREKAAIIGYVAYFKLLNGFEKTFYWSADKLEMHAKKYSKNYAMYGSGLWKDDFDGMAKKTVLKLLLSKFGPLNTQLQEAIAKDQTIDDEYDDNPNGKVEIVDAEIGEAEEDAGEADE